MTASDFAHPLRFLLASRGPSTHDPRIHVFVSARKGVDGRVKPGQDGPVGPILLPRIDELSLDRQPLSRNDGEVGG